MRSPLATLLAILLLAPTPVLANPKGGQVRSGSARIVDGAGRVDIHQQSSSATFSWDSFDIAPGEVTQFHQPGSDSVAINRIFQNDASQILGSLQANGHVYLINPNGILFGREATVNVHALIATTTVDGRELAAQEGFDPSAAAAPGARIVNQGTIQSGTGGFVYLVAPYVRNGSDGVIVSPEGEVQIQAGATVYLTDRPDGRRFAVEYTAPSGGEAVNLGRVFADGGFARLRGALVTQGGLVQANAIRERNGVVELVADAELTLTAGSTTAARGGADAGSHAGTVDVWSDGTAVMEAGAQIDVSGVAAGANGGFAELSAGQRVEVGGSFVAGAGKGGTKGEIVIDPEEIVIGGSARFEGAGNVLLAADRHISVAAGASVDLARQPGDGSRSGRQQLELRSGGDIVFEEGALLHDSGSGKVWDVTVVAGDGGRAARGGDLVFEGGEGSGLRLARGNARGVAAGDVVLQDGAAMSSIEGDVDVEAGGDVVFEAGRTPGIDTVIESGSGDVRVVAQGSVLLQRTTGSGGNAAIRTRGVLGTDGNGDVTKTDGGSVLVWAKTGDVDAGIGNRWLEPGPNFQPGSPGAPSTPFDPIPVVNSNNEGPYTRDNRSELADGILGIGTEAGGDVVVIAGGDVRTRSDGTNRSGATASGRGTTYDGAHIGAMGVPVVYQSSDLGYRGAVPLPGAPENRVVVISGGDITGDYMVRNGEASLLAGYALPAGVDEVGDLASLGLDAPGGLQRDDLRQDLEISGLAADDRRGWVGTLANPITVDLVEGSVDMLGRNGVAVRGVENPSLVYPPVQFEGVAKAPTYADDSFALLEAETGDVVLIGNQAVVDQELNPLVWLLPPSLIVRTHGDDGERPGDFVQVEDFTLFPSAAGGLALDVAGKARTANGVASGQAVLNLTATTSGAAADRAFTIPAGTKLRDPETGLIFELSAPIEFQVRRPAEPASVRVTFQADPGFENQEIVIPVGTRVEDYRGRIYVTTSPQSIPAPELRLSEGVVRFKPAGGEVTSPISIPVGTRFQTAGGAIFETIEDGNLQIGDLGVSVAVRTVAGTPIADAESGELQLVTPIAGIEKATNRLATQRPAEVEVLFTAVVPGQSENTPAGRIKSLLDPVVGARFAPGEAPNVRGGSDVAENGQPVSNPTARATVVGPVGELRGNRTFELVDARDLPRGITPDMISIESLGVAVPAGLIPSVLKQPAGDGRPDVPGNRIIVADPSTVWQRTAGATTASIRQSDADPGFDARNQSLTFRYEDYYRSCRSGVECSLPNPVTGELGILSGSGATHQGDREPALLHARLGFERIGFELAEAATLLAGPGEGEEFSGTQADILDVTLVTQHTSAADVTTVAAPYGDVRFASEERTARDQQTGLTATLPTNVLAGVTVAGPGRLEMRVGVDGTQATGVGGELALSNVTIAPDASARGIETVGNLVNSTLPVGGASISIQTAGDILLNERGAVDTLQGGSIDILSMGGSLIGGEPDASVTAKRGLFTLFVPSIGAGAAVSGGGSINVDVAGDFNIGKSVTATLSGGDIVLRARTGSVSAGSGTPFEILSISASPTSNLPEVLYEGGGIFASTGSVDIVAEQDVDIGAGITGGTIAIAAGGNITAGQGAISSSGNVSIDAGGTISGTISASGAISIGSGSVSQSASLSAGGLVVGAGSVGSNTGPGKVGAETAVAAGRPAAEQAAAQNAVAGGQSRRSGVQIDVTSRPASCDGVDSGDEDDEC